VISSTHFLLVKQTLISWFKTELKKETERHIDILNKKSRPEHLGAALLL